MDHLLIALSQLADTGLIFTMPNADTDGRVLFDKIQSFCRERKNSKAYASLGQLSYLSCIRHVNGVIGNSSSGLLEVPSFKKATINIGDRQRGRLKASSVIDCEPNTSSILQAIDKAFSTDFLNRLESTVNPYGKGGASKSILSLLENMLFDINSFKKTFYNLPSK
jgi:GDP/UDP-N,N'-diacetylbacillosamine 2-epimerase (hydrolysing)